MALASVGSEGLLYADKLGKDSKKHGRPDKGIPALQNTN
jgi:hypothetical protein